ncbi:MAG: hypothetical protein U1F45_01715 [Burkholderiales bacterium]
MARDRLRDLSRRLHLLDERVQVARRRGARHRRADPLLDGGETAVEDARPGQPRDVLQQPRLEPGQRVELLRHEQLVRGGDPLGAHELGVRERAAEIEVVRGLVRDRDPHAGRSTSSMVRISEPGGTR